MLSRRSAVRRARLLWRLRNWSCTHCASNTETWVVTDEQRGGQLILPVHHVNTPRLRLVCWRPDHVAPFAALNADPEVMRHFPSTQTVEQTQASIDLWMGQFARQGWSNWAVELKATGEFIGFIGLSVPRRVLPFSPCVEIGWRLARRFWGQGLASEGARACLRVGFEQLRLPEVVSFTALGNTRSRAVMVRIGMRDTGQDFEHPGLPEGHPLRMHCLYRITRDEWAAQVGGSTPAGHGDARQPG